jgi:hypothetical protein
MPATASGGPYLTGSDMNRHVPLPKFVTKQGRLRPMTTGLCQWCDTPLRHLSNTGRPRRYCDTRCRVAAFRHQQLADTYHQPWQRRALAEGWRPPAR